MHPNPTKPDSLGHQPALDGLRGIAILTVLFFHNGWPGFNGGFLGVDIFFALSGFLITTLLLEEKLVTGGLSLPRFFMRRGLRLYPALVALVLVSTAFSLLGHKEAGAGRTGMIALSVLGYMANWATMFDSKGWFGGMPHTWSLAIEVHFYILWALIIGWFSSRTPAGSVPRLLRNLAWCAAGIVILSAGWRAWLAAQGAPWLRMYLGTDTRLDAVSLGSLAAIFRLQHLLSGSGKWFPSAGPRRIAVLEVACMITLALLVTLTGWRAVTPGMPAFALAGLATALLILTTTLRPDSLFRKALSQPVLTWFGRISYSLYIWHVPASKFVKAEKLKAMGLPPAASELIRLAIMIAVALVSYHLIERTFVRLKNRFEPDKRSKSTTGTNEPMLSTR